MRYIQRVRRQSRDTFVRKIVYDTGKLKKKSHCLVFALYVRTLPY